MYINFTCTRATRKVPDKAPAQQLWWSKTDSPCECVHGFYTLDGS